MRTIVQVTKTLQYPFQKLNLRWNPFGSLEPGEVPIVPLVSIESLKDRLSDPRFAVQFVGECGRGKTTHIQALLAQFPEVPYLHLREGERPPRIPLGSVVCVDESQRLSRWARWRLFRRRAGLILGTHLDHTEELERAGRTVQTVRVEGLSLERLEQIVAARIRAARRRPGPVPEVETKTIRDLIDRHGDDLRTIEGELYEVFQAMEESDVTL